MEMETTGSDLGNSSQDVQSQQVASQAAPAEPTVIEVDDTTLIKPRGSDKPVKFSDYRQGFQSQATKAAQARAEAERRLAEREDQLRRYEAERQAQAQRQTQGGQSDVFEALRQLPYLTGQDAVDVVQAITNDIRQRDQILLGTLKQLQGLKQIVTQLHENSTSASFDAKINKWLTDGGYPLEAADLAKEIYLAYEGSDLDNEFPRIFADRWAQIQRILTAQREAAARAAKPSPFVPGRGGVAGPSKPMQLDPRASASELADSLWESLQTTGT